MHAVGMHTAYEPRPLWINTTVILSGKQQNGDTTRAYSVRCSSKTPDANMRSPYGDTQLLEFVWLVTCGLRNHNNGVSLKTEGSDTPEISYTVGRNPTRNPKSKAKSRNPTRNLEIQTKSRNPI